MGKYRVPLCVSVCVSVRQGEMVFSKEYSIKTSEMSGKLIGRFIGWCPVPMWESEWPKWTKTTMKLMESSQANEWTMSDPINFYFVVCETERPYTEHLSHVACLENIDVPKEIWEEIIVRRVLKAL